jgi:benzoate-CoA ligase
VVACDEPAFPAVFLGVLRMEAVPIPASTMLRASDLAVLAADSGGDRGGSVRALRPLLAGNSCGRPESQGSRSSSTGTFARTADEYRTTPTDLSTPGFLAVQIRHDGDSKGRNPPPLDLKVIAETYGHRCSGSARRTCAISVAKLFFAFGLGNSLVPLVGGSIVCPGPGCAVASPRRPDGQRPSTDPVLCTGRVLRCHG